MAALSETVSRNRVAETSKDSSEFPHTFHSYLDKCSSGKLSEKQNKHNKNQRNGSY